MIILECDRCGKTEKRTDFTGSLSIQPVSLVVGGGICPTHKNGVDLCPQCVDDIRRMMTTQLARQA
jgi:hypothetical protein